MAAFPEGPSLLDFTQGNFQFCSSGKDSTCGMQYVAVFLDGF